MTVVAHGHIGKLDVAGDARPASDERRLERRLANARLDPGSVWSQLARAALGGWVGGPVVLLLDEPHRTTAEPSHKSQNRSRGARPADFANFANSASQSLPAAQESVVLRW
jgi:hypothetical protein